MNHNTLTDVFSQLDSYLLELKDYWHYCAFPLSDYPDFKKNQLLVNLLKSIDDTQLKKYQQQPELLYPLLKKTIPGLLSLNDTLFHIDALDDLQREDIPFWFKAGIKGRKWTQIDRFSDHITGHLPVLEWCAGKGHLGRLINYKFQVPVNAVEWNEHLCKQGALLAQQQQCLQHFTQANVLLEEADHLVLAQQHAVALHACGDLHVHLINCVKKKKTQQVTLSPCCYHLTAHELYQPVSLRATAASQLLASINLSKQDLKLAVAQQNSAGERQSQLGDQEVWWRLSFDCLQKDLFKTESYMSVPSFPKTLLSLSFKEFVVWVMAYKKINMAVPTDLSIYLEQGLLRFNRLRRCELVSQFFRRPLELWLIYDRALSLQEAGYQVQLSTFCASTITPRNVLIQATLN